MKFDDETMRSIITHLQAGNVIYMPTDTIPGLVCSAQNANAVERIFDLKQRDPSKPPTIIVADNGDLSALQVELKEIHKSVLKKHWPGPVSFVLPVRIDATNKYLHRGVWSLAVRMTSENWLKGIIHAVGPLATSSANTETSSPSTSVEEAKGYFGNQIPFYVEHRAITEVNPSKIFTIEDSGSLTQLR